MQKGFQQKIRSMDVPIESEDIELYLNKAIHKFVVDNFSAETNAEGKGFEQSLKRLEDIRSLITSKDLGSFYDEGIFLSGIFRDMGFLPDDHFLYLFSTVTSSYNRNGIDFTLTTLVGGEPQSRIPVGDIGEDYKDLIFATKFYQHDDILAILSDPFNKPKIGRGVITIDGDKIYSYTTNQTVTKNIGLTYIRYPAKVCISEEVDCDLSPAVHEDIVNLAVEMYEQDTPTSN